MTEKQNEEQRELSQEIKDLASKIKAGIVMSDTKSVKGDSDITAYGKEEKPGSLFKSNLPKNLTQEMVKNVNEYTKNFVTASSLAAGELAIEAMAKDKRVKDVQVDLRLMNYNSLSHSIDRQRSFKDTKNGKVIGKDANGKEIREPVDIVKKAFMLTTFNSCYDKNSSGDLKLVRSMISEMAKDKL